VSLLLPLKQTSAGSMPQSQAYSLTVVSTGVSFQWCLLLIRWQNTPLERNLQYNPCTMNI